RACRRRGLDRGRGAPLPRRGASGEAHRSPQEERVMRAAAPDLEYQPATPDDAPFAADVDSAVHPQRPRDPVVYRYWWSQPDEYMEFARFVVTRGRRPSGVAGWSHPRWQVQPERYGTAGCEIVPADASRTTLAAGAA